MLHRNYFFFKYNTIKSILNINRKLHVIKKNSKLKLQIQVSIVFLFSIFVLTILHVLRDLTAQLRVLDNVFHQ